jgi:hypothetical protein
MQELSVIVKAHLTTDPPTAFSSGVSSIGRLIIHYDCSLFVPHTSVQFFEDQTLTLMPGFGDPAAINDALMNDAVAKSGATVDSDGIRITVLSGPTAQKTVTA